MNSDTQVYAHLKRLGYIVTRHLHAFDKLSVTASEASPSNNGGCHQMKENGALSVAFDVYKPAENFRKSKANEVPIEFGVVVIRWVPDAE